ncbi:hypothetical protein AK88_01710 [Plasmodium fragile]|uniref:Uncharacterized protein n=1 Tax=Plasmodium fragile TaxID=5857 RepID=A0A0D9QNI2_PLAFR|nr:uncharacterized protein AK88_01710 [Plasmodium fragile]KJP88630.1 hypothetical protein AK88_01710 [Plasmodium fragile]
MSTRTDGVVNLQRKTMESGKDKYCYASEHCSPYGIFNSITKCYRCNERDVDSFIISQQLLPLDSGEGYNHATANESVCVRKGEHACGVFLCKGSIDECVNINHADRTSAATLAGMGEGTSKDDSKLLDVKNDITSYAYLGQRTSRVLQTNGRLCRSVVYTSSETPTNRTYNPSVNSDEKNKVQNDLYVYAEECRPQGETPEGTTTREPSTTRSSLNTSLTENKPFNYTRKEDHLQRVDNTSSIYHPDDERIYVYDNLTAHNGARDELTLKKMKTTIQIGDMLKGVSKSEYLAKHSGSFRSSQIEEQDAASPSVVDKQLTRHKEYNSNNDNNWSTCTDGEVIAKVCKKQESSSMIYFTTEGTKVQPKLFDNYSQTVGKKKKIVNMKRRLKIGLKGRRKKKTKNVFLKKKPLKGNKLRVSKRKKMKATSTRKKIPMSKEKKSYAHRRNKKRNTLGSKNAKDCASLKFAIVKRDKKVSSDMRKGANEHLAQLIYSKLQDKNGKNKQREIELPILSQTKFAKRKSHTIRKKVKKGKEVKSEKNVQEVAKNSIELDEATKLITQDHMQMDVVEQASMLNGEVNCEVNSDEVCMVPGKDSNVFPASKMATKSVESGAYYFCLSDDVSNSSYRSFLVDNHSLEFLKITDYSDRTDGVHGIGMEEVQAEEEEQGNRDMATRGKENLGSSNPENGTNLEAREKGGATRVDVTNVNDGLEKKGERSTKKSFNGHNGDCNFFSTGEISAEEVTCICGGEYTTLDDNEERLTFAVLRKVANFLGGESGDVQSGEILKEDTNSFCIHREGQRVDQLTSNPPIDKPRDDGLFCEMVTSTSGVRSRSDDTFFEKAILNTDAEKTELMDTCKYRQSCQKDKNLFLLHSNLLKQRSFFHQNGTFENEVMYMLSSLTFYSHKLKNLLNYAIGRCPNGDVIQVKLLILCLINLVEKAKRSDGPAVCLKRASILMHELLGRVRYSVLSLSKNEEVTKFEQVIMKTYLIELIKLCRLLLTTLGGIKNRSGLSSAGDFSPHKWAASAGGKVPKMSILKTSLGKHLVHNSEDKKVFKPQDNDNEDTTDHVKGKGSGVVVHSFDGHITQMSNLTNEVVASQSDYPRHCDTYELMKGLKKKLLLLEQNSKNSFCNLRLMLKHLDKLSYIYGVNSELRDDPTGGKIPPDQLADKMTNQMDDQIRRMVKNVEENITAWTKGNEAIFDIRTLYSIKSVQRKMEKNVSALFEQLSGKDSNGGGSIGLSPRVPKRNESVEPEVEKMAYAETNSVLHACHSNQMRDLHKGGQKETFLNNPVLNYHDETEHLERLNECLNEVILSKKEELTTNPNGQYAILKEYKEELSLLNDLRNGENALVNDFLDHMPSSKFTKMLDAYVRGASSSLHQNVELCRRNSLQFNIPHESNNSVENIF